ncbi:hypothetical protein EYC80_002900 [Monilinia laxa]|uniref:Phosphoglycerate mutase (2,3-diphosphoglycerate-dependent) n=1 Tax=Monilinia laxa TaxID=61186 RepID=A0A5N6KC25_MONLA|nr:hypothetical protein EYC80_002900 [Monilinia laxa]
MRLLLVRHGETVDNVANVYAGHTDSALTNHGVLQANRLGIHLSASKISNVFSSDLQRAVKTAEAICAAQDSRTSLEVTKLKLLREQDFGYYEKKPFHQCLKDSKKTSKETYSEAHRTHPGFKDVESKGSMKGRMETFVKEHLMHLLDNNDRNLDDHTVVIVAHGIILGQLWRVVLRQFNSKNVFIGPDVPNPERGLENIGGWSNTGYLDLFIKSIQDVPLAKVGSVPLLDEESDAETPVELEKDDTQHPEIRSLENEPNIPKSVEVSSHDTIEPWIHSSRRGGLNNTTLDMYITRPTPSASLVTPNINSTPVHL